MTARLAKLAFVLAPVPFGSNEPTWVILWIVVLAASLVFAPLEGVRPEASWIVAAVTACVVVLGAHSLLAVWPGQHLLPPDPAWNAVRDVDASAAPRFSATRSSPLIAMGPVVLAALAFLNGYVHGRSARQAQRIVALIAWAGLAIAIYGIASALLDTRLILWREKTAYIYNVTGTFVNRNTAGTYFGSCTVLWFLIAARRLEAVWPSDGLGRGRIEDQLRRREMRPAYLAVAGFFVCFAALLMTGSRGGLLATMAGLLVVALVYGRQLFRRIEWHLKGAAALLIALALLLELFGGALVGRIERDGIYDPYRMETYRTMVAMIADHPLFGIGLGNFDALFPRYRPDTLLAPGIWDKGHSTWLEMLVSIGLPLGLAVIGGALSIAALLLRGSLVRRRLRYLPLAALGVGLIGSLHSCFDFSLQIPGYAVPFAALLGCGLAQRHPQRAVKSAESAGGA